jgi:hypothetical protein
VHACIRFSSEVAGGRRDRNAVSRRGQPDHELPRADGVGRAFGQPRGRLPGGCAAAEAAIVRAALVGASARARDRRDGRGRFEHSDSTSASARSCASCRASTRT